MQPARTYLEMVQEDLSECDLKTLIGHGLVALKKCLPAGTELTIENVWIAVIDPETVTIYGDEDVQPYLSYLDTPKAPGRQFPGYSSLPVRKWSRQRHLTGTSLARHPGGNGASLPGSPTPLRTPAHPPQLPSHTIPYLPPPPITQKPRRPSRMWASQSYWWQQHGGARVQ